MADMLLCLEWANVVAMYAYMRENGKQVMVKLC